MESLAFLAAMVLLAVNGSAIIAFAISWIRKPAAKIATFILGGFGILSGLWLGYTLIQGNGLMIGLVPIAIASIAIWNTVRVNK